LFEDGDIVVVAKEGHEEIRALEKRVRRFPGAENAVAVSALDRLTSGVALFVRRAEIQNRWAEAMRGPNAVLAFLVACRGIIREKGVISRGSKKSARASTTRYRRLAIVGGHSLVRAIASHVALRESADFGVAKHLGEVGHPPVGDARFGDARTNRFFEEKHALDRPFVHALRLELDRPDTNERLVVEAPLAGDLRITLERLATNEILAKLEAKNALGGAKIISPSDREDNLPKS
jgi:23S rRNA (uracil1939-C5)-methyltransferase